MRSAHHAETSIAPPDVGLFFTPLQAAKRDALGMPVAACIHMCNGWRNFGLRSGQTPL
jgi:hypothetical protein